MPSRKQRAKKKARRIQLQLDEDIKQQLKNLSDELGVSQSQLVQFFIMTGDASQVVRYLEDSTAPMWKSRINFERLRRDLGLE